MARSRERFFLDGLLLRWLVARLNHGSFYISSVPVGFRRELHGFRAAKPATLSGRGRQPVKPQLRRGDKLWGGYLRKFSFDGLKWAAWSKDGFGWSCWSTASIGRWGYITRRDTGLGKLKVALPSGFLLYLLMSYSCALRPNRDWHVTTRWPREVAQRVSIYLFFGDKKRHNTLAFFPAPVPASELLHNDRLVFCPA